MPQMPRTVDRSIAKMIATKRVVTGSLSIVAGLALAGYALSIGAHPSVRLGLALLIFLAGGSWTLRDGLRLKRDLRQG
ncbi:MAG: hypothetical protein JWP97_5735 [Labilithrix sp.]|nr:hypothetical protein [Labilithrix sp.]